jgi:hypothetical protein
MSVKESVNVVLKKVLMLMSRTQDILLVFTSLQCLLGVAYSMLASALWPMVALVIPEYQLGTAYGM